MGPISDIGFSVCGWVRFEALGWRGSSSRAGQPRVQAGQHRQAAWQGIGQPGGSGWALGGEERGRQSITPERRWRWRRGEGGALGLG